MWRERQQFVLKRMAVLFSTSVVKHIHFAVLHQCPKEFCPQLLHNDITFCKEEIEVVIADSENEL